MERVIDDTTAALMVEPIQGEAGVVVPPAGYLASLRELADRRGLLLVVDEVQTGCCRTGPFLAQEHDGVRADIVTLGKGLGAGLSISATLVNERAACFEPGDSGSTHGGNPLAAAVALSVVRSLSELDFAEGLRRRADHLEQRLRGLGQQLGARQRGVGLLQALVFDRPLTEELRDACLEEGLLVNAPRPHLLRFMPQLRVSPAEIDEMATRLTRASARS